MAAELICRANYLAVTRANVEGYSIPDDRQHCTNDVAFQVTVQLASGFEVAADVCASHEYVITANLPLTRSIRKRVRT